MQALDEHAAEGGVAGRGARYARNHEVLVDGMEALGFRCLLPRADQAPIIVTFHMPADPKFDFARVLRATERQGLLDLPRQADGCRLVPHRLHRPARRGRDARGARTRSKRVLEEMGVHDGAPAVAV